MKISIFFTSKTPSEVWQRNIPFMIDRLRQRGLRRNLNGLYRLHISIIALCLMFSSSQMFALEKNHINPDKILYTADFNQVPIKSLLYMMGKMGAQNMMIDDRIQSTGSIHLKHMTWQHLLESIAAAHQLGIKRLPSGIVWIAPMDVMMAYEKQCHLYKQSQEDLKPLVVLHHKLRYSKAKDAVQVLKNDHLISARGHIGFDERTNALWVEDMPAWITKIKSVLKQMDVPQSQVLIEAQIVYLNKNHEKDLGFLLKPSADPKISWLKPHLSLSAELAAIERQGFGRVMASPRLLTVDQCVASIESGSEVPFQITHGDGTVGLEFKKAVLGLEVKPQIIDQNRLILHLTVRQDRVGQVYHHTPSIDTRKIETHVMMKNSDTIVLGGIYEDNHAQSKSKTPVLSDIPILGGAFQKGTTQEGKTELVIFVTPHILQVR